MSDEGNTRRLLILALPHIGQQLFSQFAHNHCQPRPRGW